MTFDLRGDGTMLMLGSERRAGGLISKKMLESMWDVCIGAGALAGGGKGSGAPGNVAVWGCQSMECSNPSVVSREDETDGNVVFVAGSASPMLTNVTMANMPSVMR